MNTLPSLDHIRCTVLNENSNGTLAMKESLAKFKHNVSFVRPLYRKVKFGNRVHPTKKLFVSVDVNGKLHGDGLTVKRKIITDSAIDVNNSDFSVNIPGVCDDNYKRSYSKSKAVRNVDDTNKKFGNNGQFATYHSSKFDNSKMKNQNYVMDGNKSIQVRNGLLLNEKVKVSWLRVYPAPQEHDESAVSVVFRCVFCQLGLAAFLILWTVLWVFIIHSFEGPYETKVAMEFEKEQNQLVIDLATELRQITPLSPKWKYAIEKRIEDERLLTIQAVSQGAKIHPGQYWDLSGTFIFSVYVMTALGFFDASCAWLCFIIVGFGAPVPHTTWGRTSTLIYAALAVPTHIFLMIHASTSLVTNMEPYIEGCKAKLCAESPTTNGNKKDSPNSTRIPEAIKSSRKTFFRRNVARIFCIFFVGRCVPAVMLIYYASGVVGFGLMRGRTSLDSVMFPLEFTTTGGLEQVEFPVRVFYGMYIEGAMSLLACALAVLRARSNATLNYTVEKYRLYNVHYPS